VACEECGGHEDAPGVGYVVSFWPPDTAQPNPGQPLLDELARLRAENAKLKAVVDRLPKTADGVPYVPHSDVVLWYTANDGVAYCHVPWATHDIRSMYSTESAARAAMEGDK
jgi:hypothetical protein